MLILSMSWTCEVFNKIEDPSYSVNINHRYIKPDRPKVFLGKEHFHVYTNVFLSNSFGDT